MSDGQGQSTKKDLDHDADGHYIPGQHDDDSKIELPEPAQLPAGKGVLVLGFGLAALDANNDGWLSWSRPTAT